MNNDKAIQNLAIEDFQFLRSVFLELDGTFNVLWDDDGLNDAGNEVIVFGAYTKLERLTKNKDVSKSEGAGELFKDFVTQIQLGTIKDVHNCNLTKYFLQGSGLVEIVLQQQSYDKKLSNYVVKLHDIISNSIPGNIDVDFLKPSNIARRVMSSLLFCHLIFCVNESKTEIGEDNFISNYKFYAPTLNSAFKNYSYYGDIIKDYVRALFKLSRNPDLKVPGYIDNSSLIHNSNSIEKETYFRCILSFSESSFMAHCIINNLTIESKESIFTLVLSRSSFNEINIYRRAICVLSRLSHESNDNIAHMLIKVMQAWADPIIARAHVTAEIIHYTHLVFTLFYHLANNKTILQKYQQQIVEQVAKGLPNHLNSTDFRTISLAKMICELITKSLKFYIGNSADERLDEHFFQSLTDNDLCKEVLTGYIKDCCPGVANFWMNKYCLTKSNAQTPTNSSNIPNHSKASNENQIDSDDDDDDDLTPIESMDVPDNDPKTKIVYIRDFLEKLPEIKTYDETATVLKILPNVIRYQLKFDHEQVGKDILDAVFRWENDFDQPILDEYRKTNLCTILITKTEGNVDHFCQYFHGMQQLQPYKKNLILDVLTTVSKELPLKQLEVLANSAFNHILYDENCIKTQDVTVKIPLILFFSNILSNTLPRIMIKEKMVISYLKCLTQIQDESASTEQAAMYAIHNLVGSLEGFQFSETVQASISDTRTWLCRLRSMEINHL